jgi:hypothetical protein
LLRLFVRLGAHLANLPCVAFGCPSCRVALPCPWSPNLGQAVLKYLPRNQNWFLSVIQLVFLPSAPLCGRFHYGSSCVSLPLFVCLGAHLANWPCVAFGCSSFQLALPSPCCSCVSLRLFVCLGTHVANSPCIAFGRPCCELALRCVRVPNLGEAVLKNLPPSQNWFLSVLRLVFFPSAPLCGRFRYDYSCVPLQLIVRFVTVVRAFRYASSCVWAPILPTGLALRLGAPLSNSSCLALGRPTLARLLVRFVTALRAFGRPCCELALRCVWAPILRTRLALRSGAQPWRGRIKKSTPKPKLVLIRPPAPLFA